MKTKDLWFVPLIIGAVLLIALFVGRGAEDTPPDVNPQPDTTVDAEPIGGQRDAYYCLSPAGYSFSTSTGGCIRPWEIESDMMIRAARLAIDSMPIDGLGRKYTVVTVASGPCPECYTVTLDLDNTRHVVRIEDGVVVTVSPDEPASRYTMSSALCADAGGVVVDASAGATCAPGEVVIGTVIDLETAHVCCVASTSPAAATTFEECVEAGNPVMESYPRQCRTPDGRQFIEEIIFDPVERDGSTVTPTLQ